VGGELGELASSFDKMTQELLEEKTEVLKNIEMRAHVEVNLRKEKLFFRATLDGLSAHICVIDRCGKIVITNRAWNAFAIENDAIEGTCGEGNDYLSVCSGITEHYETDIDEFAVGISGVINGTLAQFVKEYPCHSPDTDRWFICRVDPFTVSGSKYAVISHENITERKLAEMARIKLYSAVEQSPVTIVITDVNGVIEYVNSHFTVLTGYTAEEAIGQNPRILKSDQTPPETFQELWTVISSGKTWIGEFVNKCKDGRLIYEQATISPLCDANGIITNFLGIKEDITDKKK
jgi:PAS domain S-box-containing protein